MRFLAHLALADLRLRPGRLIVTTLAVVASAAVVVWVVAGYDALVERTSEVGEEYLGRYDASLSAATLDPALVAALRQDPDVEELEPVVQVKTTIMGPAGTAPDSPAEQEEPAGDAYGGEGAYIDGDGSAGEGRHVHERAPVLVATAAAKPPRAMQSGSWLAATSTGAVGVLSTELAERLGAKVGTELVVKVASEARVTVVGIVEETHAAAVTGETAAWASGALDPKRGAGPAGAALYVRPELLRELELDARLTPNLASIALRIGSDPAAFQARWAGKLGEARLIGKDDLRTALGQSAAASAARVQSLAATAVSLLAALFIVFSTLSMGVSERTRQLAVLRAVGLSRRQVGTLIACEALALGLLGWLGGLAAGWALLGLASLASPTVFARGAAPGTWAIALSGACAFLGSLAAAIRPAWAASRVDVVAALSARPSPPGRLALLRWSAIGAALVAVGPLLLEVPGLPLSDKGRSIAFAVLGIPTLALGCLLLCPGLVVATERLLGPLLARLLGLPPGLLRAQLGLDLARTVGTTAALAIGLGLFITIQVWGRSMLGPFLPGTWTPDALVSIATCLPENELARVRAIPAVERFHPLLVEQPRLADDITGARTRGQSVVRQENVIIVGFDPAVALDDARPLFDLQFEQGSRAEARALLASGQRQVIVPREFVATTGVGMGETFRVLPPDSPTTPVEYTVAGVVRLDGWHFVTKDAGLRRRFPRAAALMFASAADLGRDFGLEPGRVDLLAFDLRAGAGQAELRAGLEPIAADYIDPRTAGRGLSIMTPGAVRGSLQGRTDAILWGVSQLPLITLLVTSLGVVNAILASVRARRWELGVLRAVGLQRADLVRLVLAEAVLIGVVACLLSLGFGFSAGWSGVAVAQYVSFFGGLAPPLVIPWAHLLAGVGATLVLCLLAGLQPAVALGRTDTLELLQAGRSAW